MTLVDLTQGWKLDIDTGRLGGIGMPSMLPSCKNHLRKEWYVSLLKTYREQNETWSPAQRARVREVLNLWFVGRNQSHKEIMHGAGK